MPNYPVFQKTEPYEYMTIQNNLTKKAVKCDLNANEISLQECQILCELRSDLVICCPVK